MDHPAGDLNGRLLKKKWGSTKRQSLYKGASQGTKQKHDQYNLTNKINNNKVHRTGIQMCWTTGKKRDSKSPWGQQYGPLLGILEMDLIISYLSYLSSCTGHVFVLCPGKHPCTGSAFWCHPSFLSNLPFKSPAGRSMTYPGSIFHSILTDCYCQKVYTKYNTISSYTDE